MNKLPKWFYSKKPMTKNVTLILSGVLIGVVAMAIFNLGNVRNKALNSLGLSTDVPSQTEQLDQDLSAAPNKTVTKDENGPSNTTTTVTNPKKSNENNQSSSTYNNSSSSGDGGANSGSDSSQSTTPTPPACVWHEYTGAELTPGVRAQIGQYVSYEGKASYVSSVGYSEYSTNGQKYNIKYNFENGDNFIPESSVQSVGGTPGYYSVGGDPIKISDRPSYCPAP